MKSAEAMKKARTVWISLLVTLCFLNGLAETIRERSKRDPEFHLYSVIFGVLVDSESKIQKFHLVQVIEPKSGTTNPVDIEVPNNYVEEARNVFASKKHAAKMKDGKPVEFFTYYFFSPGYPKVVITNLDIPIDQYH